MRPNQNGNVVIFILLAVGLFGALAYTFTRNSQQSQGSMNEQQAKIAAQEIMDQVANITRALNKLASRGCSETQISFDDSDATTSGYENPSSPPDKSCHVFDPAGGGAIFVRPPAGSLVSSSEAATYTYLGASYNQYRFPSAVCLPAAGACDSTQATKDFVIGVEYLNRQVCIELNNILSIYYALPTTGVTCSPTGGTGENYIGTFVSGGYYGGCITDVAICMHSSRTGYTFTNIMVPRP